MRKNKILFGISFFCLIISLLLTIIDLNCFDQSFYQKEYVQNNTSEETGMNEEDLWDTTLVLFDYLHDARDDLSVQHEVNGTVREIFDSREKAHMVDVKNLYLNTIVVRNVLAIVGSILFVVSVLLNKKNWITSMYIGYKRSLGLLFVIILAILIYAAIDFNSFWIQFHYLFFTNDLFFLDPNTEILINMVPEQFFFDLVIRIIFMFMFSVIVLYVLFYYLNKRKIND